MSSATQQPQGPPAESTIASSIVLTVWLQDDAELIVRTSTYPGQAVIIDAFAPGGRLPTFCLSPQAARALIAQLNMLDLPAEVTV